MSARSADWLAAFHRIYDRYRLAPVCDADALFYFNRGYSAAEAAWICTDVDPTNR